MNEYMKGGGIQREESPKGKSPSKNADVRTSGESKKSNNRKRLSIVAITREAPRVNLFSKGTMKRKINEILAIHKKKESNSAKIPDCHMLRFGDSEKLGGVLNEIFPFVITSTVRKFDVSQIFINGGKSYVVMYSELLEIMDIIR